MKKTKGHKKGLHRTPGDRYMNRGLEGTDVQLSMSTSATRPVYEQGVGTVVQVYVRHQETGI